MLICLIMRVRKRIHLDGRQGREDVLGVDGEETSWDMLCEKKKSAFSKREKYRKKNWERNHMQILSLGNFSKQYINFVRNIVSSLLEMLGLVHK